MRRIIFFLLTFTLILVIQNCSFGISSTKIDFNIAGCYPGAFVSWKTVDDGHLFETTDADIKEFEKMIARKLAIVTFYRAFSYNEKPYYFPFEIYETINKNGSLLFLTWEPRDWNTAHR